MAGAKSESINVTILIPSLNPTDKLVHFIKELINAGIKKIIVIDDGSKNDTQKYFETIESDFDCIVLHHDENKGKGRALKTGFDYLISNFSSEEMIGVVTADSDGQHSAEDTIKVAERLIEEKNKIIVGCRDFNKPNVPFKSKWGNKITTYVFALLYLKKINDTQTGLRGIPYKFIRKCLNIKGERFEFEINMLISAVKEKIEIIEEKIQTIYIDNNNATSFNTLTDSAYIYLNMFIYFFKFSLSGIASFFIDIGLFTFFTKIIFSSLSISTNVFLGTFFARAVSSFFNYTVNKNIVFNDNIKIKNTVVKYYILCLVQMLTSWLLVVFFYARLTIDTTIIKIFVDFLLFLISFQVQRRWVFKKEAAYGNKHYKDY